MIPRKVHKLMSCVRDGTNKVALEIYCQPHTRVITLVDLLPSTHDDWAKVTCNLCLKRRKKRSSK